MTTLQFYIFLELLKRILSFLFYPLAYPFRDRLRRKDVLLKNYLYKPKFKLLWFLLDDSIKMETWKDYANREKYYPEWIWKYGNDFLKSYWWSAIRNSCVNWNNYSAWKLGRFIEVIDFWGAVSFGVLKLAKKGYRLEYRRYENGNRLYFEFYLFKRWFQFGWLNGWKLGMEEGTALNRFEIDLFKRRD